MVMMDERSECNDDGRIASSSVELNVGQVPRELSDQEIIKLANDTKILSKFKRDKLEREAKKNWDLFYKRNKDHFFKDRHWTQREFQELCNLNNRPVTEMSDKQRNSFGTLLEIGCGVGNFIFPLLESGCDYFIYACDFSPVAIDILKQNAAYDDKRCRAFVADITCPQFLSTWSTERMSCHTNVDIISLIFVLSAISPEKMDQAVENLFNILSPGGIVLFRDYGLYDYAMIRFSEGHKISDNFYVRQDGTRAFYFTREYVSNLFTSKGFQLISNDYINKVTTNKKEGISVPRIFIQSKFYKP